MNIQKKSHKTLFITLVVALSICLDQASKAWATNYLINKPTQVLLGDILRLQYSQNSGAFLGLGAALPENVRFGLLVVGVGVVLLGLAIWIWTSPNLTPLGLLAASLVLGGGFSNWIDRLLYREVVDFLNFGIGPLRTGILNVADLAITAGEVLLLIWIFKSDAEQAE